MRMARGCNGEEHFVKSGIVLNLLPVPVPACTSNGCSCPHEEKDQGPGAYSPVLQTYVTAMPRITMLAMAGIHIKTNRTGPPCVGQSCYEQNAQSQT